MQVHPLSLYDKKNNIRVSQCWQDVNSLFKNFKRDLCKWTPWCIITLPNLAFAARDGLSEQGWGLARPLAQFYLMFRQLSPVQDCSLISLWFMICRSVGSTFFTMFSSWWGSDVRLYTSTNDCRGSQEKLIKVQCKVWSTNAHLTDVLTSLSANSQYCRFASFRVLTQAYVLLKASSQTQSGKHS